MGLAASQARLLTITSRKSDCEFQSMRYSHQKIALSRNMADISNEYQNALNKTKLVYDFYGNGDQTNPVTYGLLMSPSELNGYMPMLTTTSEGRVVLNSTYAAAARAAGIPQEGLGCLPSTTMRNAFYDAMVDSGIISLSKAELCKSVMYAPTIGMGTTDLIATTIETKTVEEMLETASESTLIDFNIDKGFDGTSTGYVCTKGGETISNGVKLSDIWNGNYVISIVNKADTNHELGLAGLYGMNNLMNWSGWEAMFSAIDNSLDKTDPMVKIAIDTARSKINQILYGKSNVDAEGGYSSTTQKVQVFEPDFYLFGGTSSKGVDEVGKHINGFGGWDEFNHIAGAADGSTPSADDIKLKLQTNASDYIGYYGYRVNLQYGSYYDTSFSGTDDIEAGWSGAGMAIDVSNILKTYLTTLYTALGGSTKYNVDNSSGLNIESMKNYDGTGSGYCTVFNTSGGRYTSQSKFIDNNCTFETVVDTGLNTEGSLFSGHYDAMFNQIAARGWVENKNINDKEYLREMYQNGLMFLTTCSDDGYYYQGDYSINSFIKEVADEDAIAKAEAKYNTEKQKLNHKEEIIDLKMRNLDTEISALTTEYDTIKSVISKNIERGFKRYDA